MPHLQEFHEQATRRHFLVNSGYRIGQAALGSLMAASGLMSTSHAKPTAREELPHFRPRAKRVLCLFQAGGFSHVDLFDYKKHLSTVHGEEIPPSVKGTQRITGMTSGQTSFPVVAPLWKGKQCGRSGLWMSDLLPHMQNVADEFCVIKSVSTEAINHDPGITWMNTGNQQPGYASMGAWIGYGLGSLNENYPKYSVMVSQGSGKNPGQPIFSRLWGSGFLPASHQGVALRAGANPVLYLKDPPGVDRAQRRQFLDDLSKLNQINARNTGDQETLARIDAYEMAFRMQVSVPELTDTSDETVETIANYGPDVHRPGSYAANCLLARRMLERDVRFVQLFHRGWDQHIAIEKQLPMQCKDVDQPTAALIQDLKNRGLLEDTLVMFITEFGRTVFSQGQIGNPAMGRDHHGRCFTILLAGAGIKSGIEYGQTDDYCYNIVENPVQIRDIHATMLHLLGIDHERFAVPFRGLDTRLTGVEEARVVTDILT